MKNYKIECEHATIGMFNGAIYFLVDGRLLSIIVGTPNFNDYNEFRLSELRISKQKYKPEDNDVELSPYEMEPFEIDADELAFLDKWFSEDIENIPDDELEGNESPYGYLDESQLTSSKYEDGYKHYIFKREDYNDGIDSFDFYDHTMKTIDEIEKVKLYEEGGMYCLLAHVSEAVRSNYYKETTK